MGGNDIAGKHTIRKPSRPVTEPLSFEQQDGRRKAVPRDPVLCGAMSQQRDDSGSQSMPQKLVRLIGCRDTKARNAKVENIEGGDTAAENLNARPWKANLRRPSLKKPSLEK